MYIFTDNRQQTTKNIQIPIFRLVSLFFLLPTNSQQANKSRLEFKIK